MSLNSPTSRSWPTSNYRHMICKRRVPVFFVVLLGLFSFYMLASEYDRLPSTALVEEERYLTYLPHSGLSNQRVELVNAILLSKMLNRTLIVPPAILGDAWNEIATRKLSRYLSVISSPKNTYCRDPDPTQKRSYLRRASCWDHQNLAIVPWSDIHNFSSIRSYTRMRHSNSTSLSTICKELGLDETKDTRVYENDATRVWRLFEDPVAAKQEQLKKLNGTNILKSIISDRWVDVWTLDQLRQRPERLLQLDDTFGCWRVNLRNERLPELDRINDALLYRLDSPFGKAAMNIIKHLGGPGSYLSIHARTDESYFNSAVEKNVIKIRNQLRALVQDPNVKTKLSARSTLPPSNCVPIYMATSYSGDPRGPDSPLRAFFEQFPCVTVMNDLPRALFEPVDQLVGDLADPQKPMGNLWMPLIETIVAAHGAYFEGTPHSSYSMYIKRSHTMWMLGKGTQYRC